MFGKVFEICLVFGITPGFVAYCSLKAGSGTQFSVVSNKFKAARQGQN